MPLEHKKSVLLFACFVSILILLSGYFIERNGLIDEPGFLNPPYMVAHYGKLTFPTYPHGIFYDVPVVTHPPMHVAWIGLLWRMGVRPYYAEATPTVLLFLLAILITAWSAFPTPVKLGWLFAIGFLATSGITIDPIHLSVWAIPTAVLAFLIHAARLILFDRALRRRAAA